MKSLLLSFTAAVRHVHKQLTRLLLNEFWKNCLYPRAQKALLQLQLSPKMSSSSGYVQPQYIVKYRRPNSPAVHTRAVAQKLQTSPCLHPNTQHIQELPCKAPTAQMSQELAPSSPVRPQVNARRIISCTMPLMAHRYSSRHSTLFSSQAPASPRGRAVAKTPHTPGANPAIISTAHVTLLSARTGLCHM